MSVASLAGSAGGRDVTIMTAPLIADRYGSAVIFDWDHPAVRTVRGWPSQTGSLISTDHRIQVSTSLALTIDGDPGITAYDRIVIDGDVYVLDGEPHVASTPRGIHHTEIALRRVDG